MFSQLFDCFALLCHWKWFWIFALEYPGQGAQQQFQTDFGPTQDGRTVELNVMRSELYLFEMSVSLMEKGSVSIWDVSKVAVEQLTDRQCDSCGSILFYLHQMSLVPFATENNRRRIQTVIIGGSGSSSLCR